MENGALVPNYAFVLGAMVKKVECNMSYVIYSETIFATLQGPKLEIFFAEFFAQSMPVWVDDIGTRKYI